MDVPDVPFSGQLALVLGPHAAQAQMLDLAARLAVSGPVRVFDCGNRFNVYPVARAIRSRTDGLQAALQRIRLARAFTCYQVLALLEEAPDEGVPTLVLDLLATFYDEDVKLPEIQRLLRRCLLQLRRLSQAAPLIVSAHPPKPIIYEERIGLFEAVRAVAKVLWEADPALPASGAVQRDFWAVEEPQNLPSIPQPLSATGTLRGPDSEGKGREEMAIEVFPSPIFGEERPKTSMSASPSPISGEERQTGSMSASPFPILGEEQQTTSIDASLSPDSGERAGQKNSMSASPSPIFGEGAGG